MKLENQSILFFTRTMKLGGTENVVLQQVETFKPYVKNIVVCSCGGVNVQKLDELGVKHYEIPDVTQKTPSTFLTISRRLKKIIKDEEITIIHTEHRMAAFYVALLGLYKKCYFINTSHNTFQSQKLLTRFAYKHANLIACGGMVKKNLVEFFGLPGKQVRVIHNAVKAFDGSIVEEKEFTEFRNQGYFLVGNVGRLSEQKGMEYFIDSIPNILKDHPMTKFFIIGTGELEEKLKKQVEDLNLSNDVMFMGYRSDVQNLMSQLDLVVLSSLWEGFPLTPIEAYSVGKTIVATAVDGTIEIIQNEENGLLVESRNSLQISKAVCRFIENEQLKSKCEHGAKESFEKEYSFEKFAEEHRDYYRSL